MTNIIHFEGKLLQIKGATKVVSTLSNSAVVEMGERCLMMQGENIEVKKLNLEEGEVWFEGDFSVLKFGNAGGKKGSLLKRIFK